MEIIYILIWIFVGRKLTSIIVLSFTDKKMHRIQVFRCNKITIYLRARLQEN